MTYYTVPALLRRAMEVCYEVVMGGKHAKHNAANLKNQIDAYLQAAELSRTMPAQSDEAPHPDSMVNWDYSLESNDMQPKPFAWADSGSNRVSRRKPPGFICPIPLYTHPPTQPMPAQSTAITLFDKVEFALRDAGFGLDEAFALATKATQPMPVQEKDAEQAETELHIRIAQLERDLAAEKARVEELERAIEDSLATIGRFHPALKILRAAYTGQTKTDTPDSKDATRSEEFY